MKDNKLLKYVSTTIVNTLANILTYFILISIGASINVSNAIAIIVEIPISFILKNRYVFKDNSIPNYKKFIKFIISRLFSMLLDFFGVLILSFYIDKYISKIIIQILIFFINYFISKELVFKNIRRN